MAKYRVEIGYKTKRSIVSVGLIVDAFNDTDAEDIARAKVVEPYADREWVFTRVTEDDIRRKNRS